MTFDCYEYKMEQSMDMPIDRYRTDDLTEAMGHYLGHFRVESDTARICTHGENATVHFDFNGEPRRATFEKCGSYYFVVQHTITKIKSQIIAPRLQDAIESVVQVNCYAGTDIPVDIGDEWAEAWIEYNYPRCVHFIHITLEGVEPAFSLARGHKNYEGRKSENGEQCQ